MNRQLFISSLLTLALTVTAGCSKEEIVKSPLKKKKSSSLARSLKKRVENICKTRNTTPFEGASNVCQGHDPVDTEVGQLMPSPVFESSGIAISSEVYPLTTDNIVYHINDSPPAGQEATGTKFYHSKMDGVSPAGVTVDLGGESFGDVEDIDLGPCPAGTCLFIAEMGNNLRVNQAGKIYVIPEVVPFGASATPSHIITVNLSSAYLTNPDRGPEDFEAFAVHPITKDMYILTKSYTKETQEYKVTRLFRLPYSKWILGGTQTFKHVRVFSIVQLLTSHYCNLVLASGYDPRTLLDNKIDIKNFPVTTYDTSHPAAKAVVTSMDFSSDGSAVLILTYGLAIEVDTATFISNKPLKEFQKNKDYSVIEIGHLPQMEAISYFPGTRDFVYSTELVNGETEAPIQAATCTDSNH